MPQIQFPWVVPSPVAPRVVPPNLGTQAQWTCVGTLTYASFATAATSTSVQLFALPSSSIIHGVKILHSVAFTGGNISAYTLSVGDGTNNTLFASPFNVFQAPGAGVYQVSSDFGGESLAAVTEIYATATSTGDSLNAATAGSVAIFAFLSRVM